MTIGRSEAVNADQARFEADVAAGRRVPWEQVWETRDNAPAGHGWSFDYRPVTDGSEHPADIFVNRTRYPQRPLPRTPWMRWWRRHRRPLADLPAVTEPVRFRPIGHAVLCPLPGLSYTPRPSAPVPLPPLRPDHPGNHWGDYFLDMGSDRDTEGL